MKKVISIALVAVMLLSLASCDLFSNKAIVKLGDYYTHNDPSSLEYDDRIALLGKNFGTSLESYVNMASYPDNMMYDDAGNMIGMYDYDPETGLAYGWTNLADGSYTAYEEGKEVNLGMPDASKMIEIPDGVAMGAVVYGNKEKAVCAYLYVFLPDSSALETVQNAMLDTYGVEFEKESDTVLKAVLDEEAIEAEFELLGEDATVMSKSASGYAEVLMGTYGISEYKGENAYKPFADYEDPTDLDFDKKVVLVGNGEYAVYEEYVNDLSTMTDVLYSKDGKIVGHYTYYTATSEDSAERLYNFFEGVGENPVKVTDLVVGYSKTGADLEAVITSYKGYNILKDDSIEEYTRMIEETYFSVVCD